MDAYEIVSWSLCTRLTTIEELDAETVMPFIKEYSCDPKLDLDLRLEDKWPSYGKKCKRIVA